MMQDIPPLPLSVKLQPQAEKKVEQKKVASKLEWLESNQAKITFTVVTLVGMVAGLIMDWVGWEVPALIAYLIAYITGGYYGLKAGLLSLWHKRIDVDLLMVLAAIGAALVNAFFEGVMLLFLFSLSNVLQNLAMDRTRDAIRSLMNLRPTEALIRRGSWQINLPIEQVAVGDLMIIRPGDRLPLDGIVEEGTSSLDQSIVTGESMPIHKSKGDLVLSGSINKQGALEVRVTHLAEDSTIARLIKLVEEAQSEKAPTQRFIDSAEQYYALGVILMTVLAIIVPILFWQEPFVIAFYRAIRLMVAASPCALVISTPATVLSAIGNGAKRGVLFKGGAYIEQAANIKVVAFDKTGTLTMGKPKVVSLLATHDEQPEEKTALLRLAAAVEAKSEHPLAQAIVREAIEQGLVVPDVADFQSEAGRGVQGTVQGERIALGNEEYIAGFMPQNGEWAEKVVKEWQDAGTTTILVAKITSNPAQIIGIIGIADVVRPNALTVVRQLKQLGVERVVMLTGDNERVAQAIAQQVGIDQVQARLMPADKLTIIKALRQRYGTVAMVGDGVNDAPALALADIGIAMGAAGTDVALETATVILMSNELSNIPYAIALSRKTRQTLLQNLVFALAVIFMLIISVLGFDLPLPLSVIGHEGSTVLVSLNGLRLLAYK